ncbi:penicillin-binding protein, transpeptidase [Arthrobacter crystallopoietes BAB-32]|uniref:Beta-lactamase n=1 Tax=Arthrobacter crystallopoietes BAB-32 TaxID=1246476 RepID=N1V3N6_9MICC|nr:penicillin-binding transpeptidase domain-containing protein [Arthrobacter crystallopoietes]EMY34634.1 penicillin-binding protein, transpeptidase [Arthrobacter crystallopoietes BAB-32]
MLRRAVGTVLALALVGTAAACAPQDDGRGTADGLAAALTEGDVSGLAFTTAADAVQEELAGILEGMDPLQPAVSVASVSEPEGDNATATLNYVWDVPDTEQDWTYTTTAGLVRSGNDEVPWQIQWAPSVVEPSLQAGETLALATEEAERGEILDAAGEPIVTERPVRVVGINKKGLTSAQAQEAAKELAAVVDIEAADYAAKVEAYGPDAFVDAITLREAAFEDLDQDELESIDGFLAVEDKLPLAPTRGFAAGLLGSVREATAEDIEKSDGAIVAGDTVGAGGIQAAFNESLAGTPGLRIAAVGEPAAEGAEAPRRELFSTEVAAGKDVQLTLDPKLQTAAEEVLEDTDSPSSIVALRPSTGEIVAAANGPASEGYNTAFLGQYAPGSTFKIATALGLLRQGMTPESDITCAAEFTADGRTFENADGYDPAFLGEISLTEAIAHSCNTAFVSEYENLSQDQLADAAGALGIGMTADIGLEAFWGAIPREDNEGTAHAASMIGQSRVQASPLALAVMMASVVEGELVVPRLVDGYDGEAEPAKGAELTTEEADQLRSMMRAAVTDGYLANLAALPGEPVIGKTGTAEYGNQDPLQTHSWVIAAQGDLALAVFVEDGDLGAVTGAPMVEEFLTAIR